MTDVYRLKVFDNETLIFMGDLEVTQAGRLMVYCNKCGECRAMPMEKVPFYIKMLKKMGVRKLGDERLTEQISQEIEKLGGEGTSKQLNRSVSELILSLSN